MNENKDERVKPSEGKKLLFLTKIPKDASPAEIRQIAEEVARKIFERVNQQKKWQRSELLIFATVLLSAMTFFASTGLACGNEIAGSTVPCMSVKQTAPEPLCMPVLTHTPKVGENIIPLECRPANAAPSYGTVVDPEEEKKKAIAGDYDVTINGIRYGTPAALARAERRDYEDEHQGEIRAQFAEQVRKQNEKFKDDMTQNLKKLLADLSPKDQRVIEMWKYNELSKKFFDRTTEETIRNIMEGKPLADKNEVVVLQYDGTETHLPGDRAGIYYNEGIFVPDEIQNPTQVVAGGEAAAVDKVDAVVTDEKKQKPKPEPIKYAPPKMLISLEEVPQ